MSFNLGLKEHERTVFVTGFLSQMESSEQHVSLFYAGKILLLRSSETGAAVYISTSRPRQYSAHKSKDHDELHLMFRHFFLHAVGQIMAVVSHSRSCGASDGGKHKMLVRQ
jgi:hypothetical protein